MARAEPRPARWLLALTRRHPDLVALAAFVCLALLVVREALLPGRALLPLDILRVIAPWEEAVDWRVHNGALSDVVFQGYPFRAWFIERLRAGEFPLWHPDILTGHPIAGDGVAQIFYPLRLLLAPLPVPFAMSLSAAIHLCIAGAGAYGFCRALGASRPAALLGGLTYELSGVLIVWLSFPQRQSTTSWIPAVLWATTALTARPGVRPLVGLAASLALLWLGGMFQFAAYASLLAAAFALFRCADRFLAERDARALLRRLASLAAAALLGLMLAAPQLLPAVELAALSHREPLTADYAASVALPAPRLLQWLAPNLFGTPLNRAQSAGSGFMESTAYVGLLPLFLSLAAWPLRRDRSVGFFALALLGATLLAVGTPLVALLYAFPGLNLFNVMRMVVLIPVCVVPLAALGLDALLAPPRPARRWPILLLPAAAALALALAAAGRWPEVPGQALFPGQVIVPVALVVASAVVLALLLIRPGPLRLGLVVLVAAADLALFALPFNTISLLDRLYPLVPPLDQAVASARGGRLLLVPDAHFVVGPNVPSVLGLAEVGGYSSTTLRRFREAIAAITLDTGPGWMRNPNIVTFNLVDSRILQLFAVSHVLVEGDRGLDLRPAGDGEEAQVVVEPERPLRQEFIDPADGLNAVAVRLAEPAPDPPLDLELLLRRAEGEAEIARVRTSSAEAAAGWVRFPFKAERDSGGKRYWFEVAPVGGRAVALRLGRGGEVPSVRFADGAAGAPSAPLALTLGHRPSAALRQIARANGVRLYEVPEPVARARLVHEALTVDSPSAVLHELASPSFDPRRRVILEGPPSFSSTAPQGEERVTLSAASANALRFEVEAAADGWLVVADNLYPGWEAWLDGAPVPVLAANHTQRAVAVPAGRHQVELRYSPLSVRLGALAAAVALLTCSLVLALAARRGRAGARGTPPGQARRGEASGTDPTPSTREREA